MLVNKTDLSRLLPFDKLRTGFAQRDVPAQTFQRAVAEALHVVHETLRIMRIHILSDLHLEFGGEPPTPVDADVVVLAGDIDRGVRGVAAMRRAFGSTPLVYVAGNHEYYGGSHPRTLQKLAREAAAHDVHLLEQDEVVVDGVRFLGCTLWSDFELNGDRSTAFVDAQRMNDFRLVRVDPSYRRFKPHDAAALNASAVRWLESRIAVDMPTVVVTHHAPSRRSISNRYVDDPISPCYASNLDGLVERSNARFWVHGHIHARSDYTIGGTRVIANPRGYPMETVADFDPALVIEV